MSNFNPTDEQLFDYYLQQTEPALTRQIAAYLNDHPQAAARLDDYAAVEQGFAGITLAQPSEHVLRAVLANAERELKQSESMFTRLTAVFQQRFAMSFALVVLLAVGLYVQVRGVPVGQITAAATAPVLGDSALTATFQTAPTQQTDLAKSVDDRLNGDAAVTQTQTVHQQFQRAVSQYQAGQYKSAAELFAAIDAAKPDFDQRRELYTFWIDALQKDGQATLAAEKQHILESFPSE